MPKRMSNYERKVRNNLKFAKYVYAYIAYFSEYVKITKADAWKIVRGHDFDYAGQDDLEFNRFDFQRESRTMFIN